MEGDSLCAISCNTPYITVFTVAVVFLKDIDRPFQVWNPRPLVGNQVHCPT